MNLFKRLFEGEQLVRSREILEKFQAPRHTTTTRDSLFEPREGQIIFNQTTSKLNVYNGTAWEEITST